MIRVALFLALVFLFLAVIRLARPLLRVGWTGSRTAPPPIEAEMVRDPVCGTWIDRRLALSGRRGGEAIPVCSEKCRRELEAG